MHRGGVLQGAGRALQQGPHRDGQGQQGAQGAHTVLMCCIIDGLLFSDIINGSLREYCRQFVEALCGVFTQSG